MCVCVCLYIDGDDDDEEDSDYEVDYAGMNVSPEILRMLGARYVAACFKVSSPLFCAEQKYRKPR